MKNKLKRGLALLLALTMVNFFPVQASAADTLPVYSLLKDSTAEAGPAAESEDGAKKTGTQELAAQKAVALTSFYGASSVQYALIDNGNIVLSGNAGYANKASRIKPTKDTMYGIGSISKIYTTAAVMQLADAGRISLEMPVTYYIPEFKMQDERYKNITVRMLLNHSSGLMGSTLNNAILYGDSDHSSYDNLLDALSRQRLKADPGAFSVYCNDGFTLAEMIVERVSGMTFSEYLRKNILDPIQVSMTKTPVDTFSTGSLAQVYNGLGKQALPYESLTMIGAGGIYSSAEALCRFSQSFMANSNGLLSENARKAMENEEFKRGLWLPETDTSFNYGLGWDSVSSYPFNQYNIKALKKSGDIHHYHASLIVLPEYNLSAAVLTAGASSAHDEIMGQEILISYLKEKGIIKEEKTLAASSMTEAPMPEELAGYSGNYANLMAVYQVEIKDSAMTLSIAGSPANKVTLSYMDDGWFSGMDGQLSVRFVTEPNQNSYLVSKSMTALPSLGTTYSYMYEAQKLAPNPIPDTVLAAWKAREGSTYLPVSEKYSSYMYLSQIPIASVALDESVPGYVGNSKIIDSSSFITDLAIPIMYGRDLSDGHFYRKNGIEYLQIGETRYISTEGIKALSAKQKAVYTIASTKDARYYKIPSALSGKKIKVTVPKNATFVVISSSGAVLNNYYLSKKSTATLPKGGYIAFVGSAGAKFTVEYN